MVFTQVGSWWPAVASCLSGNHLKLQEVLPDGLTAPDGRVSPEWTVLHLLPISRTLGDWGRAHRRGWSSSYWS